MAPRRAAALPEGVTAREHLITAAAGLVAERGTAGLTVRDVARAAGLAPGVLYNHFADREELLALALHRHVRRVEEARGFAWGGGLAADLRAFVAHAVAVHRAVLPALAGLVGQPELAARFEALGNPMGGGLGMVELLARRLRAERDAGNLAAGADVETVATLVVGACHELAVPRLFGLGSAEAFPPGCEDAVVETVLHGVLPR
ncbi:TetR/AcrR family transcriptional regulator [Actinosynnema pretiosum]|uniref:TetR family transcriptional regulator n=1 Tax=Actinosynnema pretiosum TaxID=42197 RepID=A0A290Z3H5_9PSEU|nr:TetR/AcrR family transcriptional regulator [Actinosynnema pretiosum]ATE53558.1 TetR family transcriptional regulator [Actinosynnema pretiosum]